MITFNQKEYSEYEAMNLLVNYLRRNHTRDIEIIDKSQLVPVLKGNSVVVERFVISSSLFGKDKYRAYFKMGAKVKMPDKVYLPKDNYRDKQFLGRADIHVNGLQGWQKWYSEIDLDNAEKFFSELSFEQKDFGKGNNNNQGPKGPISFNFSPNLDLSYEVEKSLAETIKYDKTSRSLILEYPSVDAFFKTIDILPFGISYKKYILDV